jgi:hypothetical protein
MGCILAAAWPDPASREPRGDLQTILPEIRAGL